jgi:hypothetical protein
LIASRRCLAALALAGIPWLLSGAGSTEYRRRIDSVRNTPGFVALWDFVVREDGPSGKGRFTAWQTKADRHDFALDAVNYVLDYWGRGRRASYGDFPLLGRGPFGQAIRIVAEKDADFRPCLLVPRSRLHDSGLDVKGPGRSVSMVVWMLRESGNHAVAGIWHEGTDLHGEAAPVTRVEQGRRQYALFTGLAANNGAAAVHVSENGGSSFGDKYARNLAVTREQIRAVAADADAAAIDGAWIAAGFVFDNARNTVTAYLDGKADDYWIDDPQKHPFFQWPARGWQQAQLRRIPGLQPGEDPAFPPAQFYEPPEEKPLSRTVVSETATERVELHRFAFTKVRVTLRRGGTGKFSEVVRRELASLQVNPFWFGHDLYAPARVEEGGPFTIGRVIHTGRSVGATGWIGGVAVFGKALSPRDMARLAALGRGSLLRLSDVNR